MKTILFAALVIISVILSGSCHKAKKNMDDYFPKVRTVSAVIQSDGSVLVTGSIDSKGAADVEYAGFSCSTSPSPKLLDRQAIANIDGNSFKAVYKGFDTDSTYYFISWATNKYGYKYGTVISLSHIIAPAVTPTCTLAINTINYGNGNGTIGCGTSNAPVNSFLQEWTFTAYTAAGYQVYYTFGSPVTTGIYTTTASTEPPPGYVHVAFNLGNMYSLDYGTQVYVNTVAQDTADITICNAPWVFYPANTNNIRYMNTRIKVPL